MASLFAGYWSIASDFAGINKTIWFAQWELLDSTTIRYKFCVERTMFGLGEFGNQEINQCFFILTILKSSSLQSNNNKMPTPIDYGRAGRGQPIS